jgi:hypothetical protein
MIDSAILLGQLKAVVTKLEADILNRCRENSAVDEPLRLEFEAAKQNNRTAVAYEVWRGEFITQAAAAWVLATVFVRFIEDNGLLDGRNEKRAWISGAKDEGEGRNQRLQIVQDTHLQYFRANPSHTDREYLQWVFRTVCNPTGDRPIRALEGLFDERHNPLWRLGVSGDGATLLLNFWQQVNPETGQVVHDFTDPQSDTRFLGDLYQDLSEAARKKYALLQTPIFVEEFILDRTLTPAIAEFGLDEVRLIDPTCGSGHFLLGAFERLFQRHQKEKPAVEPRKLAQTALEQVYGVDLNPFATAIARFRLLIAALKASEIKRLQDAPDFRFNLATGDSLLHGKRFDGKFRGVQVDLYDDKLQHHYETEDTEELKRILGQQYHAVVGNPPYITVKDPALNKAYRDRFDSCHISYSLAVPFMERFFDLTLKEQKNQNGDGQTKNQPAGFTGMITANSFMKREFGKKLVEVFIPRWDLTTMIDTSGAYIPGHGTPTVILFGRQRRPVADTIRSVMGIKGEPSTPAIPANGKVWQSIVRMIDNGGSQNEFVSVVDTKRESFYKHPWSIGGGGAAELKEFIDEQVERKLEDVIDAISSMSMTRLDDVYYLGSSTILRNDIKSEHKIEVVIGEYVRDWNFTESISSLFPYDEKLEPVNILNEPALHKALWNYKQDLWRRKELGGDHRELNRTWYEWNRFLRHRFASPSIIFAFVSTHNHFVFDKGEKVFIRSSPAIKLPKESTEESHFSLLGLLNSSIAGFWMRQIFHNKGSSVDDKGARQTTVAFENFYEYDVTKLKQFPLAKEKPLELAKKIDELAQKFQSLQPSTLAKNETPSIKSWQKAKAEAEAVREQMIFLQEELDWQCYKFYNLTNEDFLLKAGDNQRLKLGERAFEIVMARKMAAGELETRWFERHNSTPITELPADWSDEYKALVERRINEIETNSNIRLIEQPEYKRRWNTEDWDVLASRALREWLLNRLESEKYWSAGELLSTARLADKVRGDAEFAQVADMYRGRADFDFTKLIDELVKSEAVPLLPVLRYKDSGMIKRAVWERTWEAQRREDAIEKRIRAEYQQRVDASGGDQKIEYYEKYIREEIAMEVGEIEVPPKYASKDFRDANLWRLRGKLDVPKERFAGFPYAERDADQSLVIGWAGWNHLELAQAIAGYYTNARQKEGWSNDRLVPLLGALVELLPWIRQWHDEINLDYGGKPIEFFESFVEEEARSLGLSINRIREWSPFQQAAGTLF